MPAILLSLSENSYIDEPDLLLSRLYGNFLTTLYDQTTIYRGKVASLAYLVAKYHTTPSIFCTEVENTLIEYLSPYFDQVNEIQVTTDVDDNDPVNKYNITIYISVIKNAIETTLSKSLYLDNGVLTNIFNEINNGK